MAHYLFVITGSLDTDVTARFALRSARALCQHDHQVTVFLADEAAHRSTAAQPWLDPLIAAGARILAAGASGSETDAADRRILDATEHELAGLLLTPGIRAQWC